MSEALASQALDQLFRSARTQHGWTDQPVTDDDIRTLYQLMKWGPTSANSSPVRFVWGRSQAGKEKLAALAWERNRRKVLAVPLTVIIGHDLGFADHLPHPPLRADRPSGEDAVRRRVGDGGPAAHRAVPRHL